MKLEHLFVCLLLVLLFFFYFARGEPICFIAYFGTTEVRKFSEDYEFQSDLPGRRN